MVIFIFFLIRHANPIPPPLFRCRLDVNNVSTTCDHHLSCFHWRVISSTTSLDRLMAEPDHIEPATFELSYHGNHPTYSLTAPIHRLRAGPSSTQLVVHIQYNMANGTPPQQKVPQRFISDNTTPSPLASADPIFILIQHIAATGSRSPPLPVEIGTISLS